MVNIYAAYRDNPADYRHEVLRAMEQSAEIDRQLLFEFSRLNNVVEEIVEEMSSIRRTAEQGLAVQQAMLVRQILQDRFEEFVYQFEKLVARFDKPNATDAPSTQFHMLDCLFRQIQAEGISTVLIKGRENKAAFETCVNKGKDIYLRLRKHPEVQKAIAWSEQEKKKRLAQEAAERQRQEAEAARIAAEQEAQRRAAALQAQQYAAHSALKTPAVLVLVFGSIMTIFNGMMVLSVLFSAVNASSSSGREGGGDVCFAFMYAPMGLATAFSLVGGYFMLIRKNHPMAVAGSVALMLGGWCCAPLTIAIGVWSLVVLLRPEVRSLFT